MSWTFFGFSYISKKEREKFSEPEVKMIELHELYHRRRWWHPVTYSEEYRAFLFSLLVMLEEGYTYEEILNWEFRYRFWQKYDKLLEEIEEDINEK